MSNETHRGPWRAVKGAPGSHPNVWEIVADMGDHCYEVVAHVSSRFTGTLEKINEGSIEANAKLIASAPDMLSTLEQLQKWATYWANENRYDSEQDRGWRHAANEVLGMLEKHPKADSAKNWSMHQCLEHGRIFAAWAGCSFCKAHSTNS